MAARAKAKKLNAEAADAEVQYLEAKAVSSGGSNRSRSDRGTPTPVKYPSGLDPQLAAKMAERRRKLDNMMGSSPGSSLAHIDEGSAAPIPVLPPVANFPSRVPGPSDQGERSGPVSRPTAKSQAISAEKVPSSTGPNATVVPSSDPDVDDHARATAVQKQALLKHKRPPTPPTPRSGASVASTRSKERLAALEARLAASEAQTQQAVEFAQNEQIRRLDAESRAGSLKEQLHSAANTVLNERASTAVHAQTVAQEAQHQVQSAAQEAQKQVNRVAQEAQQYVDHLQTESEQWCAQQWRQLNNRRLRRRLFMRPR